MCPDRSSLLGTELGLAFVPRGIHIGVQRLSGYPKIYTLGKTRGDGIGVDTETKEKTIGR